MKFLNMGREEFEGRNALNYRFWGRERSGTP
jgi:hypothetical protein